MTTDSQQDDNYGMALYHPKIHIRDVHWLKSALLYWDGVRRIVPDRFPPDEEDETREDILQVIKVGKEMKRDLLPRTSPKNYVQAAANRFLDRVVSLQHLPKNTGQQPPLNMLLRRVTAVYERLAGRKDISHSGIHDLLENMKEEGRGGEWVDFWDSKMTKELKTLLEKAGLLRVDEKTKYVWLQKATADLYMMCLATVMKENIKAPLVTDFNEYEDVGKFLDYGQPKQQPNRIGLLLDLKIPFPSPDQLREVPMSAILECHYNSGKERGNFRKAVEKIVSKAAAAQADEYRYEDFLSKESEEIKDAIEAHKQKLDTIGVKGVGSLLKISAPTALTSLPTAAAAFTMAINPITLGALVGTGIALSLVAWWAEVRGQRRDETRNCPWHYLLSLEQRFPQ